MDPTYDNSYYTEYKVDVRVPRIYKNFKSLLGEDNFWDTPSLTGLNLVQSSSKSKAELIEVLPDPYLMNQNVDWITEYNRPNPSSKTIGYYGKKAPEDLVWNDDGYKLLKELFYDIQQTSYYCDFAMESAQFSFEKMLDKEKEDAVKAEREVMEEQWRHILRGQVAPMRWSLKIWTRYNIAEPVVDMMQAHFSDDWTLATDALNTLPVSDLASQLMWDDYSNRLKYYESVRDRWISEFQTWKDSCKPEPSNRIMPSGSSLCEYGISLSQIRQGEADAAEMWHEFFHPLL